MRTTIFLKLVLILIFVTGCSFNSSHRLLSDSHNDDLFDEFPELASNLKQEHMEGTFDGTILISRGEDILFRQSYGYADRVRKIANSSEIISDIGSISKTFTAAAILILEQQGKLKTSDTLAKFYPSVPRDKKDITIEQLLVHSSGFDNFHSKTDFDLMTRKEAEDIILSMPLRFKAEEKVAYSNAAYTLLAAIVERVSGQLFQEFIYESILRPLKLSNTGFYKDSSIPKEMLANGYGGNDEGQTTFEKGLTWALVGAGGVVASIEDMKKWFESLSKNTTLGTRLKERVFKSINSKWTLGNWTTRNIKETSVIQMGGSTEYGYTALIQYLPKKDLLVILLFNSYSSKYSNATHHMISRNVILPILKLHE